MGTTSPRLTCSRRIILCNNKNMKQKLVWIHWIYWMNIMNYLIKMSVATWI